MLPPRNQRLERLSSKRETEGPILFEHHGKAGAGGRHIRAGVLPQRRRSRQLGGDTSDERHFGLVERHHRFIDLALGVRREVDRPLAVRFVVGGVEAVIVKVGQRQVDLMKGKPEPGSLLGNRDDTVRLILELADEIIQRMGRACALDLAATRLRPRRHARLLRFLARVVEPLAPRSLVEAEQPLVHVVRHDVVQRRGMVADDQHNHPHAVGRHVRDLRMKAVDVAAVIGHQVTAVGCGPATHAVRGVEQLTPSEGLQRGVRHGDGRLQRRLHDVSGDDLSVTKPAPIHEGDQPVGQILNVRVDRARRPDRTLLAVVRDCVE